MISKKSLYLLLCVLLITLLVFSHVIFSQISVLNIRGIVFYDPVYDHGLVSLSVKYSEVLVDSVVEIPLIGNISEILNVTDIEGRLLTYSYVIESNSIKVFVNESDTVIIEYSITGLFSEIMVDSYVGFIDLTIYGDSEVDIELDIIGQYVVESYLETIVNYESGLTKIILNKPDIYMLTLYILPEAPSTPGLTQTTKPTISPSPTSPTTTAEEVKGHILLIPLTVVIIIVIILFVFLKYRKK